MNFSTKSYWDKRYENEDNYEWLIKIDQVNEILKRYANNNAKVLILGCGNSNLSYELYAKGYRNIISTDYSETIIEKMKCKYKDIMELKWECHDMFNLPYDWNSFDIIFEKGVIDAVLANENQWTYAAKFRIQFENFMLNVHNILKRDGKFLSVSFHQPMFRLPLLIDFSNHSTPFWKIKIEEIESGFHFILYNFEKSPALHHSVNDLISKYSKYQRTINRTISKESYNDNEDNFLSTGFEL